MKSCEIAASNKNWEVAHCCLVITDNTGLGPGELRAIKGEHMRLEQNKVYAAAGDVGDKNEFRIAPVALNEPALAAFEILEERYKEICRKQGIAEDGKHYLIPRRVKKGTYDPRQQASPSFIRSALREIRAAAGMPRLRHYDFRHQCLTTLLEIPEVSIETVQAVARHKDRRPDHRALLGDPAGEETSSRGHPSHDSRRFAALRRPPQRQDAESVPARASGQFCREPKLSTALTEIVLYRVPESCKSSDTQGEVLTSSSS
jgi:integrase